MEYGINDNELYDIVCDWLSENSYPEPNYLDYSENTFT